jgi:hypothetical protein
MRWLGAALVSCLVACSASADEAATDVPADDAGAGGTISTAGATGAGGTRMTGGSTAAGGTRATGGATGAGGTTGGGAAQGVGGSDAGSSSGGSSGTGGSGGFVPPTCSNGSTKLPAGAPGLTPGTWKDISPAGVAWGANGNDAIFTQGMALDPCNAATLYVTQSGFNTSTFATLPGGLWRSTDAGASWSKLGQFDQPLQIRVDPKDPLHLYVGDGVRGGTTGFWVSKDGGQTWTMPQGFQDVSKNSLGGDTDVYHVEPDPTDFDHVLVTFHWYWDGCASGCNSGVLESFDGGDSWTVHPANPGWAGAGGYGVFFLYSPALGIGDDKTWLYGTQGKGNWRTSDSGATWTKVTDNNMEHGGGQLYYTKSKVLYAGGYPSMMRSTDNGVSWQTMGPSGGFMSVYGDGTTLHSGFHQRVAAALSSPESDGVTWGNYNAQVLPDGPFEQAFDSANGILYSARIGGGMWALKVK